MGGGGIKQNAFYLDMLYDELITGQRDPAAALCVFCKDQLIFTMKKGNVNTGWNVHQIIYLSVKLF